MKVRYDKLWRLMKDNKMKKSDLSKAAEISSYAMKQSEYRWEKTIRLKKQK